jgi:hypothetical protein
VSAQHYRVAVLGPRLFAGLDKGNMRPSTGQMSGANIADSGLGLGLCPFQERRFRRPGAATVLRLSYDYSSLLPVADAINVSLASLPAYDATIFTDQLDAGNSLGAILDPMSANTALVPTDVLLGALSPLFAALGTAVNLTQLFS